MEEPAVEVASWLLGVLFDVPSACTSLFLANAQVERLQHHPLIHLTSVLRSSNLPLKFLALRTISRALQLYANEREPVDGLQSVLAQCHLDFVSVLHAANNRFARESVQQRVLFSQYLQVFVEVLLVLRRLTVEPSARAKLDEDILHRAGPPMNTSMFAMDSPRPSPASDTPTYDLALSFDRKKCRSALLHIADDGLSVSYSGNEMWKMVVACQSFSPPGQP
ncbi:hypothetical protein ATCC90586_011219 [Pythium insidiosum]|nr:hypothetical protein ATCC90586_011219 [Pythium insidiosum]